MYICDLWERERVIDLPILVQWTIKFQQAAIWETLQCCFWRVCRLRQNVNQTLNTQLRCVLHHRLTRIYMHKDANILHAIRYYSNTYKTFSPVNHSMEVHDFYFILSLTIFFWSQTHRRLIDGLIIQMVKIINCRWLKPILHVKSA